MTKFHKQVFIGATGTDIGKTYVTQTLIRQLRRLGYDAKALKPIISGFDETEIDTSDTGQLLQAMDTPCTIAEVDKISPWRFSAPLSPNMAARQENKTLDMNELVNFCLDDSQKKADITFIEGVGGIMVPLTDKSTTLDWQEKLNIPCLLLIGSYLGTMSHCLTSLDALAHKNITPLGIILNASPQSPVPLEDTASSLAPFVNGIPIITLKRNASAFGQEIIDILSLHS